MGEEAYFLPDSIPWPAALLVLLGIALAWAVFAAWNEKTEKMVISCKPALPGRVAAVLP